MIPLVFLRLAGLGAVVAIAGFTIGLSVLGGVTTSAATTGALTDLAESAESCVVSGPVPGLSDEQAQNAAIVASTSLADSAESFPAARVALMVAYTESSLRNLGPMPGNAGSLGLFQQRVSEGWGTAAEELDPAEATAMFTDRLVSIPGWAAEAPWTAGQQVQRSAFTNAANYHANWTIAGSLLSAVMADANVPGGCGQGPGGGLAGPPGSHGLPTGYTIPAGTMPAHTAAVEFALAQLGKPYAWGASGPASYDCSGLTEAAWAVAGVHLLHYTVNQLHEGLVVAPALAEAGDLVLIPGSDPPGPGLPGHVGIYLGDGLVISAVDPALGVAVQSWATFVSGGLEGVIDPAPGR